MVSYAIQCICFKFQCKEWGFLLKPELFGVHLGTGDYGQLVIYHSAMLLRQFRSLYKYSGKGFEASHKLHRNLQLFRERLSKRRVTNVRDNAER